MGSGSEICNSRLHVDHQLGVFSFAGIEGPGFRAVLAFNFSPSRVEGLASRRLWPWGVLFRRWRARLLVDSPGRASDSEALDPTGVYPFIGGFILDRVWIARI